MAAQGPGAKPRRRRIPIEQYDRVSTMLIAMVPYGMITKQLSQEWKRPKSYVMLVIRQVHEDWAADAAMVADTRRHQIRHGFEALMMKAQASKDISNAVRIQRELGLLDGCYAPTGVIAHVNHGGSIGVGISLGSLGFKSPDEVKSRIDEIKARLAAQGPTAIQGGQAHQVVNALIAGEAPDNADQAQAPVDEPAAGPDDAS